MSLRFALALALAIPFAACTSNSGSSQQEQQEEAPKAPSIGRPDAEGKVHIRATADDFVPSRVEVEGGKPVTLVFFREVERSCMTSVVFPELGIEEEIPMNTPVEIEVTPEAGGTIAFQCPMAMGKSVVVGLPQG